mmetsp:Transcript_38280/g.69000  ORF Transcript_38280/g.69000 Transcript_38280/m.69000 type:complete len:223 (-) Transcript_38280:1972-2640(-)
MTKKQKQAIPLYGKLLHAARKNISLANYSQRNPFWTRRMSMILPQRRWMLISWPCLLPILLMLVSPKTRDGKRMQRFHHVEQRQSIKPISPLKLPVQQHPPIIKTPPKPTPTTPQSFHSLQSANMFPTLSSPPSYSTPHSHSTSSTQNAKSICNYWQRSRDGGWYTLRWTKITIMRTMTTIMLAIAFVKAIRRNVGRKEAMESFRINPHRHCSHTTNTRLPV